MYTPLYAPLSAGTTMGLCENVSRRGAVYWWRARFGVGGQGPRVVAISLQTRDPECARRLGARLNGFALGVRDKIRAGHMSFENVKEFFVEEGTGDDIFIDPRMVDEALARASQREPWNVPYTVERERRMLADMGRRVVAVLHRRAADVRFGRPFNCGLVDSDWVGQAIAEDRVQAQVYRLLGLMGSSAQVRPEDRARLIAEGFDASEIEAIDAAAKRQGAREAERDWRIGPDREVLIFHLDAERIAPTDANVRRLRGHSLCLLADLVEKTRDRYTTVPSHIGAVADEILADPDLPERQTRRPPIDAGPPHPSRQTASIAPTADPAVADPTLEPAAPQANDDGPMPSFLALVESLVRMNLAPKTKIWDDKTARQHLSIARLFVKIAKTDDPRRMTQHHVGAYLELLHTLPIHWGKSTEDADRSIDEIMARVEDLDDDEIGLAVPTIKRHRGQLTTILAHAATNGYAIGTVGKKFLKDTRSPDEKRRAFTVDEGRALMASAPWTISDGNGPGRHPALSGTDAQFWVPLLGWYMLTRLGEACGLMVEDVDLDLKKIHIQHNKLRRLKNNTSQRTPTIHPELLRLGFIDFVLQQKALGHEMLFPELFGKATAATVVFNKQWVQHLDAALPNARAERKTMHSTRKGGNGAMIAGKVMDPVRYYIMGHAPKDIHGRHYVPAPSDAEMIEALSFIPIITDGIPALT